MVFVASIHDIFSKMHTSDPDSSLVACHTFGMLVPGFACWNLCLGQMGVTAPKLECCLLRLAGGPFPILVCPLQVFHLDGLAFFARGPISLRCAQGLQD